MLKTLDDKAKAAKTSKMEGKKAANKKGGEFPVKEKLSLKFCKEFGIQYVSQSTKDGVTTYTYKYLAGKGKSDPPAKKKKKAEAEAEAEDDDEDEDEDDDDDGEFDYKFFLSKLKKTLSNDRAFANKLLHKYEPTVPMKKIKELSDAKMFKALADIMCYDEE